ncbi:hypothetical protein GCM10010277_60930 [Streptomyces longisporoflavus]|nr:hypothetical protein GCM10010277_60930 [Streptomyces longisporoflavus]
MFGSNSGCGEWLPVLPGSISAARLRAARGTWAAVGGDGGVACGAEEPDAAAGDVLDDREGVRMY